MRALIPGLAALTWLAACGTQEEVPVAQGPTRADSVQAADQMFDPSAFDTIQWATDSEAIERGNLVFRISCSKCHGESGRGNGNFVLKADTLRPPSFLAAEWRFADDPIGLRRQIFTGNVAGMPYWGLVGLKYRDIDAVALYITRFLRTNYSDNAG
ncbi:MAG: c-type cytochrome [Gemmatimonadota bacterium]|nr:c-type cytochrome [Gemmatimonadota bacterium]MDH5759398.1 c-type cytochrome [Gemmatimonadota bacterium]